MLSTIQLTWPVVLDISAVETTWNINIGIVSESHPHGDQQLVGYSDIIGRVNEKDDSDEEDETEIAVSEWPPPHGDWQRESCPDSNSDGEPCSSKQQSILDEDFDEEIDLVLVSK